MPPLSAKELTTDLLIRYGFQILGALVILGVGLLLARYVGNLTALGRAPVARAAGAQPHGEDGAGGGADLHPRGGPRQVRLPGGPAGGGHRGGRPRRRDRAAGRAGP